MSQLVPRQLSARVFPYLWEYLDIAAQMHTWERVVGEDGEERSIFPNRPDRVLPSLLRELDLEAGRVWTFLPDEMDEAEVAQFTGHEVPDYDYSRYGNAESSVVAYVERYLRASQTACGIFDPQIIVSDSPVSAGDVTLDDEIYLRLDHERSSERQITDALKAGGYWDYGILSDDGTPEAERASSTITHTESRRLVGLVYCIIFSAFDDTGFVIWQPERATDGRDAE